MTEFDGEAALDLAQDPLEAQPAPAQYTATTPELLRSAFFSLPPIDKAACEQPIRDMTAAWQDLQHLSDPQARIASRFGTEETCLQQLLARLPDPEAFTAGGLRKYQPVLAAYFALTNNSTRDAKTVLAMLKGGIKLQCVPANDKQHQSSIPQAAKKRAVVQQMLARATSPYTPEQLLAAPRPMQVHFPNHSSARRYADFVGTEIDSMLAKGVIKVRSPSSCPMLTNPA